VSPSPPLRIAVFSLELPHYACALLRVLLPARAAGVELVWAAQSDGVNYAINEDAIQGCDLILVQRAFPQAGTWPLIERLLTSSMPLVYELDDLLLALPDAHPLKARFALCEPYVLKLLGRADLVTVSAPALARALAPLTKRIEVIPNALPEALWRLRPPARRVRGAPVRVGFAGTESHLPDLELIEPALEEIAKKYKEKIELLFYGCVTARLGALAQARVLPFAEDYAAYCRGLPRLGLHIGLAPLLDSPFNRCKSDVKWQEYAACGAAGVYARLDPYRESVRPGQTGLLAEADPAAWLEAIERLISDPELCMRISQASQAQLAAATLSQRAADFARVWRSLVF
jgi:glycosyltransferase involved in cell wall biosynthesis